MLCPPRSNLGDMFAVVVASKSEGPGKAVPLGIGTLREVRQTGYQLFVGSCQFLLDLLQREVPLPLLLLGVEGIKATIPTMERLALQKQREDFQLLLIPSSDVGQHVPH